MLEKFRLEVPLYISWVVLCPKVNRFYIYIYIHLFIYLYLYLYLLREGGVPYMLPPHPKPTDFMILGIF